MKREFLEGLGIDKETVDKIMKENGDDINSTRKKLEAERDDYKKRLDAAQESLKSFEGVDVAELKGKVASLTKDLETKDAEYASKIADMEFNDVLSNAIKEAGGRNVKAIKAMLDIDTLKASKNRSDDIKTALESTKKSDGYLFGSSEPINSAVSKTGVSEGGGDPMAAIRAAMGLPAETK
jgi:hypothetical protein